LHCDGCTGAVGGGGILIAAAVGLAAWSDRDGLLVTARDVGEVLLVTAVAVVISLAFTVWRLWKRENRETGNSRAVLRSAMAQRAAVRAPSRRDRQIEALARAVRELQARPPAEQHLHLHGQDALDAVRYRQLPEDRRWPRQGRP